MANIVVTVAVLITVCEIFSHGLKNHHLCPLYSDVDPALVEERP